jgi:hypothetical protein
MTGCSAVRRAPPHMASPSWDLEPEPWQQIRPILETALERTPARAERTPGRRGHRSFPAPRSRILAHFIWPGGFRDCNSMQKEKMTTKEGSGCTRGVVWRLCYICEISLKIVASASRTLPAESTGNTLGFNFLSALPIPSSNRSRFCPLGSTGPPKNAVFFTIAGV